MSNDVTKIHMSEAVQRLLGPDLTRAVDAVDLASSRCHQCKDRLEPSDVVNVVVFQDQDRCVVGYVHPYCGSSHVHQLPAQTLVNAGPATLAVQLSALLQHHGNRLLPVLTVKPVMALIVGDDTRPEPVDAFMAALVQAGMTADIAYERAPEPLLAWPVTIATAGPGKAAIQVRMPTGSQLFDGVTAIPARWREAASRYGWCVLYASRATRIAQTGEQGSAHLAGWLDATVGARLRLFGASRNTR